MSTPPCALRLRGLVKRFGNVTAVDHLDLDVRAGEIVAVLGPNGAGKTTTLDIVLGLSRPDAGSVEVLGGTPEHAIGLGRVSALLQSGGLLADLTVAETVQYTAALFGHARPVGDVLERAGITELADRRVGRCSGGQKQRLRFAMALVSDPDLVILDEPTTGMDVEGRRAFWAAIRQDAEAGRTVLFATHYLDEADSFADRIVVVRHGRVVADGTPAQVRALAAGRVVRAYLPHGDLTDTAAPHDVRRCVQAISGVTSVEREGDRLVVRATDSDAVARYLLTATAARDVEISSTTLEDAFVAITSDDAAAAAVAGAAQRGSAA